MSVKKNDLIHLLQGIALLFFAFVLFLPGASFGQIRSGVGYLKILPGARQIGMAGSLTGALDYTDAFYANPGAGGFMREWQWSASYTNWISDLYNASFLYGRQFRTPWSRRTQFVLGMNYLGIPNFDSSEGATPMVSGNDLVVTANIGQPLSAVSDNVSLGANIKYLRSELADFHANAAIFDFGLLYRTPRFALINPGSGFLDYAIFSAGIALTNVGSALTFISEETPLPRTLRAGAALNLGSHHGFQVSLASDYHKVRDEDGFFTFGTEFSWGQIIALRLGYSSEDNVLGDFRFGVSFKLDDYRTPIADVVPGRNNALRFDMAANQSNDFFASPFHGSVTHLPIGPEKFRITRPVLGTVIESDSVQLAWEDTRDPDLFDAISYWLLVDQDSLKLARLHDMANQGGDELFLFLKNESFAVNQEVAHTRFILDDLRGGDYFWSVFAYDTDDHIRFAEIDGQKTARFRVTIPIPEITGIEFDYSPWITEDDDQGVLKIAVMNTGERKARNVTVAIYDSSANLPAQASDDLKTISLISEQTIAEIAPGDTQTVRVDWRTKESGLHYIRAAISNPGFARDGKLSEGQGCFFTIPKGTFATSDTVIFQNLTHITYELPLIGKIFFDSSQTEVKPKFIRHWIIEPPLVTLAKRLRADPDLHVSLQGTADPNSGEDDVQLADGRAVAVRDSLIELGVRAEQMELLPGLVLPVRTLPQNPDDRRWIMQERRRVDITTEPSLEEKVFGPLEIPFHERDGNPVTFSSAVRGAVPFRNGEIRIHAASFKDSVSVDSAIHDGDLTDSVSWRLLQTTNAPSVDWTEKDVSYALMLVDSLERTFRTHPQDVHLATRSTNRERMYFGVAKFGLAEPFYNFYWANLMDRVREFRDNPNERLRFIGHACAIGSEAVNMRLSEKRAKLFNDRFLQDLKIQFPNSYEEITRRMDPPEWFGETKPFWFRGPNGQTVLLGDNETPLGRQLNRRVIALFYSTD